MNLVERNIMIKINISVFVKNINLENRVKTMYFTFKSKNYVRDDDVDFIEFQRRVRDKYLDHVDEFQSQEQQRKSPKSGISTQGISLIACPNIIFSDVEQFNILQENKSQEIINEAADIMSTIIYRLYFAY